MKRNKKNRNHTQLRAKPVRYQLSFARKRCQVHHFHNLTIQQKINHTFSSLSKTCSSSKTHHYQIKGANCAKDVSFHRILCRGCQVNCVQRMSGEAQGNDIGSQLFL
jgi:hypothetical protein